MNSENICKTLHRCPSIILAQKNFSFLRNCTHIFERTKIKGILKQPFEGPYKVISGSDDLKNFIIEKNSKLVTVSGDLVKPAHLLEELGEIDENDTVSNYENVESDNVPSVAVIKCKNLLTSIKLQVDAIKNELVFETRAGKCVPLRVKPDETIIAGVQPGICLVTTPCVPLAQGIARVLTLTPVILG